MSVTEELHDRRGHEVKGQAIEQRVCGIHVRETRREESPYATRGDVAHVDAKVVEHEPQQGTITSGAICLHRKRPSEVNTSVDCDDSIEDELAV